MKTLLKILIFIIAALLTGIFSSFLVYSGLWETFSTGWKTIGFFGGVFILLVSFYVTLTVHELAHLIAFKVQGVGIRALYLTIFVFHKTEKGWRLSVNPKLWILFGGLVVPDLPEIPDDQTEERLTTAFARALIAAPVATIVFASIVIMTFILSVTIPAGPLLIGIMGRAALFVTLLSALYTVTFFLSNDTFYGDVVAWRKIRTDDAFRIAQFSQYLMFSTTAGQASEDHVWKRVTARLREHGIGPSLFDALVLSIYLTGIIREDRESDETVDRMVREKNVNVYLRKEPTLEIAYEIALFHYRKHDVERAYRLHEDLSRKVGKHIPEALRTYLAKRSAHLMHLEDNSAWLSENENIHIGQFWIFETLVDPYEHQKETHQPLPYIEYSSPVAYLYEHHATEEEKSDPS
jgi:hypothetical protein